MKKIETWETIDGRIFKDRDEAHTHEKVRLMEEKLCILLEEIGWNGMDPAEVANLMQIERKRFWEILNDAR